MLFLRKPGSAVRGSGEAGEREKRVRSKRFPAAQGNMSAAGHLTVLPH
jgi:hypothetical protein